MGKNRLDVCMYWCAVPIILPAKVWAYCIWSGVYVFSLSAVRCMARGQHHNHMFQLKDSVVWANTSVISINQKSLTSKMESPFVSFWYARVALPRAPEMAYFLPEMIPANPTKTTSPNSPKIILNPLETTLNSPGMAPSNFHCWNPHHLRAPKYGIGATSSGMCKQFSSYYTSITAHSIYLLLLIFFSLLHLTTSTSAIGQMGDDCWCKVDHCHSIERLNRNPDK